MTDVADGKDRARRTWGDSPTGIGAAEGLTPGTREFFERSMTWRKTVEQPWLPEVAPFHEWAGKRVLEIGHGPGFDAHDLVKAGALYSGIDITPENVERARAHLALYGLEADVRVGDAEALPFPDESFDVVYSNGVLHHTPDMDKAFAEAFRVLKPGGRFYVIVYHRALFYWVTLYLWHWLINGDRRRVGFKERVREIEWNRIGEKPIVNVYSPQEVRSVLCKAGFRESSTKIRKLVPEDLPHVRATIWLNRLIPQPLLNLIAKRWGWYICAVGQKPI